jgi:hypothetical protein
MSLMKLRLSNGISIPLKLVLAGAAARMPATCVPAQLRSASEPREPVDVAMAGGRVGGALPATVLRLAAADGGGESSTEAVRRAGAGAAAAGSTTAKSSTAGMHVPTTERFSTVNGFSSRHRRASSLGFSSANTPSGT